MKISRNNLFGSGKSRGDFPLRLALYNERINQAKIEELHAELEEINLYQNGIRNELRIKL